MEVGKKITVIRDRRERDGRGWLFEPYEDIILEYGTLQAGDYAIKGLEELFTIERKGDTNEVKNNTSGRQIERFHKAMEKLMSVKHPFMFIESRFTSFYDNMQFTRVSPNDAPLFLMDYQLKGLNVVFCEKRGMWYAVNLIRKFAKLYNVI